MSTDGWLANTYRRPSDERAGGTCSCARGRPRRTRRHRKGRIAVVVVGARVAVAIIVDYADGSSHKSRNSRANFVVT